MPVAMRKGAIRVPAKTCLWSEVGLVEHGGAATHIRPDRGSVRKSELGAELEGGRRAEISLVVASDHQACPACPALSRPSRLSLVASRSTWGFIYQPPKSNR